MTLGSSDEWRVIQTLLPRGWDDAARQTGAFQRARSISSPAVLLRLLLLHAVSDSGLRETTLQARAAGLAGISAVALLKRLRASGDWLAWITSQLAAGWRSQLALPKGLRARVVDGTTIQGPASHGIDWRLHYCIDLCSLNCDWFELTGAHKGEALRFVPMSAADVVLADRNYFTPSALQASAAAGAHVLIRMRWCHPPLEERCGRPFRALSRARVLRVGEHGDWPVQMRLPDGTIVRGRVVATRLPAPLAARAVRRASRQSTYKRKRPDPRSLRAARYVLLFTTLPARRLGTTGVLELYRARWQVELAFKRLKQLLKLGHLPNKDRAAARTWILAKLLVALLLEALYRQGRSISPWGYDTRRLAA